MSIMERMMGLMMERMSSKDKEAMMDSMMEKFFADITAEEKQKMMMEMMPKMMEGINMTNMMPKMMMGMMSEGGGGSTEMPGMMGKMMQGNGGSQMPEIMLKTMMPNCIEIMLPKISVNQRGEVAASILSAIVEKGIVGMSNEQASAFRNTLDEIVSQNA